MGLWWWEEYEREDDRVKSVVGKCKKTYNT